MMDLERIVELSAFLCAFGMALSGIPPCLDMWRKNTFHKYAPLSFFFICIVNCLGWTHYGFIVRSASVFTINLFGSIMNIVYVLMFAVKSPVKMPFYRGVFFVVFYLGLIYNYIIFMADPDDFVAILGACMSATTMIMQSTPILDIVQIISNRSVVGIHFTIMFASTFTSLAWLFHGHMMGDNYVKFPNFVGLFLGIVSFVLYAIFREGRVKED